MTYGFHNTGLTILGLTRLVLYAVSAIERFSVRPRDTEAVNYDRVCVRTGRPYGDILLLVLGFRFILHYFSDLGLRIYCARIVTNSFVYILMKIRKCILHLLTIFCI